MDFVIGLYPDVMKKAKKEYNSTKNYPAKDFESYLRGFMAWFLLEYIVQKCATPIELAFSFPLDYFSKKDKEIIKNFIHFNKSLFQVKEASENKYVLIDLWDNKKYNVKTIDLDGKLNKGDFLITILVKSLKDHYFFYGDIILYDKEEAEEIKIELMKHPGEKYSPPEIEWDIGYKK